MKKKERKLFMQFSHLIAVIFLIITLILSLCWKHLFDIILRAQLRLTPSSLLHKVWMKNDVPIYLEVYLFNFTNADNFKYDKKVVPNFQEIGPFYFQETREKVGVSWSDFHETISFNQTKKWHFLPEKSQDLLTKITTINPVATTIAHISRLWESKLQKQIANALINAHEPFLVTASAKDWLFDGIPDKFLELFDVLRTVTDIPIPYNKFGWFYNRNMSSSFDGTFVIKTGRSSVTDVGMMVSWNNESETDYYEGACSLVYGTTGEIIPPLKPFQKSIPVFASDICSYITLTYAGVSEVNGVKCYEYVGDKSVFENGTIYPDNSCFYLGESCPSGLRNISSCRFGSPAFVSFPHFYLADTYYSEKLRGMNPDEKKHRFSLKVEPKTGIPLAVNGSFQVNFLVQPFEWCDEFRDVPKFYVPMLWFRQIVNVSKKYSMSLKIVLLIQATGGCLIFGICFSFIFGFFTLSWMIKKMKFRGDAIY